MSHFYPRVAQENVLVWWYYLLHSVTVVRNMNKTNLIPVVPDTNLIPVVPDTNLIPVVPDTNLIPVVPDTKLIPVVPDTNLIPVVPDTNLIPVVPKVEELANRPSGRYKSGNMNIYNSLYKK
ncbi:hypothetical protein CEXT_273161 [Caerostris extrusa]|uniref:Uncharacterized protein n=1 Tax=Caerostris extrusa TaxID=172846 RepID=A0AAV4NC67_CAEEX|nr:hypothetical protein CEXT_273161 [Caerostris extrusa]